MSYLFLEYPKCNTCRNAKKWLDEHKITYEDRHIIDKGCSYEKGWYNLAALIACAKSQCGEDDF